MREVDIMKKLILVFCLCIFIVACTKQAPDVEEPMDELVETVTVSETEEIGGVQVEESEQISESEEVSESARALKGILLMQITDKKPELNITSLLVTISDVKVHKAGAGEVTDELCTNETVINEVCGDVTINDTITICVNQTIIDEDCINTTVVINGTNQIILNCTNVTRVGEVCNDTINQTIIEECHNETDVIEECTNETTGVAGWFTIVDEAQTFDLIQIQDVNEFLGSKELDAGKYTQIRLSIDDAKLEISGEEKSLKIPSGKIKLVKNFNIAGGGTTTLTLDFDAEKSVHQAGSKYIMKPTIKVIQG
jgi:hypothetical protein